MLRAREGRRNRPAICICTCKSHCTTLNPTTGQYEGPGHPVSRSTRDNHRRDDRLMALSNNIPGVTNPTVVAAPVTTTPRPVDTFQQVKDEISLLLSQPLSDPLCPLVFNNRPEENGPFIWPNDTQLFAPNEGLYSLKNVRANRIFLQVAYRLRDLYDWTSRAVENSSDAGQSLLGLIIEKMEELTRLKEVEWSQQRGNSGVDTPYVNTEIYFRSIGSTNRPERVSKFVSLVMENIFFTPRRALRNLLAGTKSLLRSNGASETVLNNLPIDPRAGSDRARLNPITRQFVICPSCHKLYPYKPGDSPLNNTNPFISVCKERRTQGSNECNTPLWKDRVVTDGESYPVPVRKYVHQDLKSWLGRLLSRKGMEALMDKCKEPPSTSASSMDDIWTAEVFKELRDAPENPFLPGPPEEGRLIFSLSVDGFNPLHNKTAKQNVSSTGIWMVLLNLPPHLRYLHENMYVAGVIPGPDKPSREDIYPYLELVMEDLLEFWYTGVRFSRTESTLQGRLYRALLIPLICDMPAARQVVGLGAATSHSFCTFCELDIDDIDVSDRKEWPQKELDHIRRIAQLWKEAASVEIQQTIFESYGIWWSPLHTLPYWDLVRFTVVDPMHALDLNLIQNHCRHVFQIDLSLKGGDGTGQPTRRLDKPLTKSNVQSLRQCIRLIQSNDDDLIAKLLLYSRPILYKICVGNNIVGEGHQLIVGTKWILAKNICAWRGREDYHDVVDPTSSEDPEAEVEEEGESRSDLQRTFPSDSGLDRTSIIRILRLILDVHDTEASHARAYQQGTLAMFLYICNTVQIQTTEVNLKRRNAKRLLFNKILHKVDNDTVVRQELMSYIPNVDTPRAVLGSDVMEEVWTEMTRTQVPSWITPVPTNWGTTQRGKLSANNWRVICMVHLPITLIRLWSNGSDRKMHILSHFMDLVAAVRIANMRITSDTQIQEYNKYMTRYITALRTLYPDQHLKPSHHAALHIGDMLGLFGPNHSHSGPHYERYINFFHRVNTNMHIGELESTLLYSSARSANIRAILADNEQLRKSLMEVITVMDQVEREDIRGFRLASILDPESPTYTERSRPEASALLSSYHHLLCERLGRHGQAHIMPTHATFLKEISQKGVCYGVSRESTYKNSAIIYQNHANEDNSTYAGIIKHIIHYRYPSMDGDGYLEDHFLFVEELVPIENSEDDDPYRRFLFGGYICQPTGRQVVIVLSQVVSHFAKTKLIDGPHEGMIHVLPLDRLMLQFDIEGVHGHGEGNPQLS